MINKQKKVNKVKKTKKQLTDRYQYEISPVDYLYKGYCNYFLYYNFPNVICLDIEISQSNKILTVLHRFTEHKSKINT